MVGERFAASVRVRRGARWLDENFSGWEDRINIDTLELNNGDQCICGQLFYEYAVNTLFSEANSWITAIIKQNPVEAETIGAEDRANEVSIVLGFNCGQPTIKILNVSDRVFVSFDALQEAWEKLLTNRYNNKVKGFVNG